MEKEPKDIILCDESGVVILASSPWELDKPVNFQWMPGGVTTVCAHYSGKPIELTVNVTATTAQAVQASFQDWFRYRPKQTPFGCIEHREQEAALRLPKDVAAFTWKEAEGERDAGVYCTAVPTGLGAKNVTEKIHESWSPSFTTDAAYNKAKTVKSTSGKDFLIFPKGVRGSRENPAEVTGCAFSVGSLTNKPAFRNISAVRAVAEELYEAPEPEKEVEATWSDGARQKALEARKAHATSATDAEKVAYAHRDSERAYSATLHALDENSSGSHQEAHLSHMRAATHHGYVSGPTHIEAMKAHFKLADTHGEEHRKLFTKANSGKAAKASEEAVTDLSAVYASLSPNADELKKIYASLSGPKDPMQELYDRLEQPEHANPAGRQ